MSITRKDFENSEVCDDFVVKQIMPAHGVMAIFAGEDGTEKKYPVVCWALLDIVDDSSDPVAMYQNVEGMVLLEGTQYLDFCGDRGESIEKFIGYEYSKAVQ